MELSEVIIGIFVFNILMPVAVLQFNFLHICKYLVKSSVRLNLTIVLSKIIVKL